MARPVFLEEILMTESKEKQQRDILKKIDNLVPKTRILSSLVPLNGDPVPGHTWEEFDKAYQANQEIGRLMDQLRKLK